MADGLDAVRKVEELKPDLIPLDICLPTVNGLQAAGEIRELAPRSKIIFVSRESSADLRQKALNLAAHTCIVKTELESAACQLLWKQLWRADDLLVRFDYRRARLSSDHVVPDGILDQFGGALGTKHLHHSVLMIRNSPGRHIQYAADFLHHLAFGQQL